MRKIFHLAALGTLLMSATLHAKVLDPKPVQDHGIEYRSHANYVEAKKLKTNQVLWKQVVFEQVSAAQSNPALEQDVQWIIIKKLQLESGKIRVENSKGEIFFLDKKTGHLLPAEQP